MFVGLPASGKSTVSASIIADNDMYHRYSTDDLVEQFAEENDMTYSEAFPDYIKTATDIANDELAEALELGVDVIWDQTNMTIKKRRQILQKFDDTYRKECICILPPFTEDDVAEWKTRLGNRPGKVIPEFVLTNMAKSFQLPTSNEGFNSISFYDINGVSVDRNKAADLFGSL